MKRLTLALLASGLLAASGASLAQMKDGGAKRAAAAPSPQQETQVWVNTDVLHGTVTSIDSAGRRLSARTEDGRVLSLAVGRDVDNFENLREGEQVVVRYTAAEAIALARQTDPRQQPGEIRSAVESFAATHAGPGTGGPASGAAQPTTVLARVSDVDRSNCVLRVQQGSGEPVDVLVDPKALEQLRPDEQIAISFKPPTVVEIESGPDSAAGSASGARTRDASR